VAAAAELGSLGNFTMTRETKIIVFLAVLGVMILSTIMRWLRSRALVRQWAKANGYELVKITMSWYKVSPFLESNRQESYQIRVRDQRGRERCGWAIVGGYFLGFLSNKVEVEWD
jgi:hypothetical protein